MLSESPIYIETSPCRAPNLLVKAIDLDCTVIHYLLDYSHQREANIALRYATRYELYFSRLFRLIVLPQRDAQTPPARKTSQLLSSEGSVPLDA